MEVFQNLFSILKTIQVRDVIDIIAIALIIFGLFRGKMELLVYGYCVSLVYSAITRIIISLRRTAIVYIQ